MATIVQTNIGGFGQRPITEVTLTASNTFTYQQGTGQILLLRNTTAGPLTPLIIGSAAQPVQAQALGIGPVATAGGYSHTIAIAATTGFHAIPLDTIFPYLAGTINITGGTGLTASLLG